MSSPKWRSTERIAVGIEPRWAGRVSPWAINLPSPSVNAVEKSMLSRSTAE